MGHSYTPPAVTAQQQVTSSDLVRRFGAWQERAAQAPVYIIHRGRPRLVLVSVDIMEALCTPLANESARAANAEALADALDDPLLTLDSQGRVRHANAAARARFGAEVHTGAAPSQVSSASGGFLADAVRRVLDSGVAEEVEVVPDRYRSRRCLCRIEPLPDGALLRVVEASAREEQVQSEAALAACHVAVEASAGAAAIARVGPRGFLVAPGAALTQLTGTVADQLASARFLTLLDVADRARVGEAIEAVFATARPATLLARLLVRGAEPRAVTLGVAPVAIRGRVEELVVMIVAAT